MSSGKGRPPPGASSTPTGRRATVRVKTARGRTVSSQRWLQRQLNDPYVAEAKKRGYRSRAAFKLLQLDDQFHFLKENVTTASQRTQRFTKKTIESPL